MLRAGAMGVLAGIMAWLFSMALIHAVPVFEQVPPCCATVLAVLVALVVGLRKLPVEPEPLDEY